MATDGLIGMNSIGFLLYFNKYFFRLFCLIFPDINHPFGIVECCTAETPSKS